MPEIAGTFAPAEPYMAGRQARQGRGDDLIGLVRHQIEVRFGHHHRRG